MASFQRLPNALFHTVSSFLNYRELVTLYLSCKILHDKFTWVPFEYEMTDVMFRSVDVPVVGIHNFVVDETCWDRKYYVDCHLITHKYADKYAYVFTCGRVMTVNKLSIGFLVDQSTSRSLADLLQYKEKDFMRKRFTQCHLYEQDRIKKMAKDIYFDFNVLKVIPV